MRNEEEAGRAIRLYADTVRRICMVHLKNYSDTEDIFQTVFLKYVLHSKPFESEEHEKAWIIRAAANACKDLLRSAGRRRTVGLEAVAEAAAPEAPESCVLDAVMALPDKYREAVYLYYYEGYSAREIGALLGRSEAAVNAHLSRGRNRLRTMLGGECCEHGV